LIVGAVVLAGSSASLAEARSAFVDARAEWTYDDNLNRAERDDQRDGDHIFELDALAGYRVQLSAISGLIMKLGLETDLHADTGDLNAITAATSLTYLIQPVRGFNAPWFALTGEFRLREHSDSDIRDGTIATLAVAAGKQITDRIAGQLRYEFRDRDANKGRVFELNQRVLTSIFDYRATDRVTAYIKYDYLDGGLVTTALPQRKFRGVTRAFARDPAFGRNMVAWRLDGDAHTLRLGGKYAIAKQTALDAGFSYSHSHADNDNQWNVWNAGLSLVHRFQ
jgi:hypothetical protein